VPPFLFSRYTFSLGFFDDDERLSVTEYEPFRFQLLTDNQQHVVQEGDTLFSLAGRYLAPLPRAAGLWWILADFQPDPILDPTLLLEVGRTLVIPSVRTVTELIFAEDRRQEVS
jgi:hypothetical protein